MAQVFIVCHLAMVRKGTSPILSSELLFQGVAKIHKLFHLARSSLCLTMTELLSNAQVNFYPLLTANKKFDVQVCYECMLCIIL